MRRAIAGLTSVLLLSGLFVTISAIPATAATRLVDPTDVDCADTGPVYCNAAQALLAAVSGDTIQFAAGTHSLSDFNYIVDTQIIGGAKDLTIIGAGPGATTLDGGGTKGGIRLQGPATYQISDLTILDGTTTGSGGGVRIGSDVTVTVENVVVTGATAAGDGGGISVGDGAIVELIDVTVSDSESTGGNGGGMSVASGASVAIVDDSTIDANTADDAGGGIHAVGDDISLTISDSTIDGNTAAGLGGGINFDSVGGDLSITDASVVSNTSTAGSGGGAAMGRGTHAVQRSLFYDNTAGTGEGHHGGGVYYGEAPSSANSLTITNSTFSANDSGEDGGGVSGQAVVASSTFTLNHAGGRGGGVALSRLRNTIVEGNTDIDPFTHQECYIATSDGYNLVGTASGTCFTVVDATSLYSADASLAALADNGGPTLTHALQSDSDAINGGNPATQGSTTFACPTIDQRSEPRALHRCDIGAFEEDISGSISGTVTADGAPASGVDVVLLSDAGLVIDTTSTSGAGTYTLITAGEFSYVLRFAAGTPQYRAQWWDDRPTLDSADAIVLANYEVVAGYDAALVEVPTVGLFDPTQGRWHLRDASGVVTSFYFGNPGDYPLMGDWNCDGIDTPGMYRQSNGLVYLRNSNTQGVANITFFFGNPGDVPIVGDFNDNGCDTVSIYRPSNQTFYIVNALGADGGGLGPADFSFVFGNPGDKPFTGDFNGNGQDTIGLHRESTGFVYFRNTLTTGVAHSQFFFGNPGDRFVTGAWIGAGYDSPAVFRPGNITFYFRHTNTQGGADAQFVWGNAGWLPVSGHFGLD